MKKQKKKSGYKIDTTIHCTFYQGFFLQTFLNLLNTFPDWCNNFYETNTSQ